MFCRASRKRVQRGFLVTVSPSHYGSDSGLRWVYKVGVIRALIEATRSAARHSAKNRTTRGRSNCYVQGNEHQDGRGHQSLHTALAHWRNLSQAIAIMLDLSLLCKRFSSTTLVHNSRLLGHPWIIVMGEKEHGYQWS
jgi:hypothetical protein